MHSNLSSSAASLQTGRGAGGKSVDMPSDCQILGGGGTGISIPLRQKVGGGAIAPLAPPPGSRAPADRGLPPTPVHPQLAYHKSGLPVTQMWRQIPHGSVLLPCPLAVVSWCVSPRVAVYSVLGAIFFLNLWGSALQRS